MSNYHGEIIPMRQERTRRYKIIPKGVTRLFEGKLDRVRDLFIFATHTGLAFCDTQAFDFESMTKKEGKMYYIDGSRIKTDTKFFTPILAPAMKVLEKYDYQLPKISNQKANDYLHVIQMELHISQKLTFHVASHNKTFY